VVFEPTIAVLERAKTVRALDRSTTAIGNLVLEVKEETAATALNTALASAHIQTAQ
jgi:uncharacterized protein YejL (UPF0352 family)